MPDAPPPVLEVDGLEVRYGRVPAVRSLSFALAEGECVGLVGPNGAGKSTTLHAIMGVVPPASGDIRHRGSSIVGWPPERIARAGVALVPEGRHVYAGFSVEENLKLGLTARRSRAGLAEDVERVYELFPVVSQFRKRQAGVLSGGQQQQLAIARALVASPDVLLLDEPSLGLAPAVVDSVFDALDGIRRAGVTLLVVEQRAQLAVAFADRTYVLANGELRLTLTPADAGNTELMTSAYFSG